MWLLGMIVRGPADLPGQVAERHRDGLVAVSGGVLINAAPAAPLARHQRRPLAVGAPADARRATRCRSPSISQAHPAMRPVLPCAVFPAIHCPAPGHHV
jgi:hypothetical protein